MANYDIFICYASEDREAVARPITEALLACGAKVWWDEINLSVGNSLSRSISRGLADSNFGLVILSTAFFGKGFPEWELSGLVAKEIGRDKVILPIWHGVNHDDVAHYSLPLADKIALRYDLYSPDELALKLLQEIRPDIVAKTISRLIPVLDLGQVDQTLGSVQHRLSKAKTDVWVSGNDCAFVAQAHSGFIESTLKRDIKIKILCVDPESAAVDMLPVIDPRFHKGQDFIDSMFTIEKVLRNFRSRYPSLFEFRYLPILPAMGFFITDRGEPSGIIKIEIYTAKPWQPMVTRPHFVFRRELTEWRKYFIYQWANYWNISRIP